MSKLDRAIFVICCWIFAFVIVCPYYLAVFLKWLFGKAEEKMEDLVDWLDANFRGW